MICALAMLFEPAGEIRRAGDAAAKGVTGDDDNLDDLDNGDRIVAGAAEEDLDELAVRVDPAYFSAAANAPL
jgi:hypothetical protein